jgi:hypothetical protein
MKCLLLLLVPMLFLSPLPCQAQSVNDNLFSLDLSYSLASLLNQGWGLGLNYEKKLFDFLSVKGNIGHMTFLTGIEDVYSTSVSMSVFFNYYPLSNGLDKLYISAGSGCDFMNYFGKGDLPPTTKDTLIHITPQLGWKFNVLPFLMIDVSTGYKFIVLNSQNYNEIKNYVNPGFLFGLNFLIFLNKITRGNKDEQND